MTFTFEFYITIIFASIFSNALRLRNHVVASFSIAPNHRSSPVWLPRKVETTGRERQQWKFKYDTSLNQCPWLQSEINILILLKIRGFNWRNIAKTLQRSENVCRQFYQSILDADKWSTSDQEKLKNSVLECGEDWVAVSRNCKKLPDSCKSYYDKMLSSYNCDDWTSHEDALLIKLYTSNEMDCHDFLDVIFSQVPTEGKYVPETIGTANWRNISHYMHRTSQDCRKRYCLLTLGIDLDNSQDFWYFSEIVCLMDLVRRRGNRWSEHARSMGRSMRQCYSCYHSNVLELYKNLFRCGFEHNLKRNNFFDSYINTMANSTSRTDVSRDISSILVSREVYQEVHPSTNIKNSTARNFTSDTIDQDPLPAHSSNDATSNHTPSYAKSNNLTSSSTMLNELTASSISNSLLLHGTWSASNDAQLLQLHSLHANKWKRIGAMLRPPRTSAQCFQRFQILQLRSGSTLVSTASDAAHTPQPTTFTSSAYKKRSIATKVGSASVGEAPVGWTINQTQELCDLVRTYGPRWTHIGSLIHRTSYVCRAAYKRLVDKDPHIVMPRLRDLKYGKQNSLGVDDRRVVVESADGVTTERDSSDRDKKTTLEENTPSIEKRASSLSKVRDMTGGSEQDGRQFLPRAEETSSENLIDGQMSVPSQPSQALSMHNLSSGPQFLSSPDDISASQNNIISQSNSHPPITTTTTTSATFPPSPLNGTVDSCSDLHQPVLGAWTKEEDEQLRRLVASIGRRWTSIAERMHRSPEDVQLRHDFKVAVKRQGPWHRHEDALLMTLVASHGPRWTWIGEQLQRTGQQCSIRYRLTLDPRLKWRLWTRGEDARLVSLRDEMGYSFAMISAVLDRASGACRYRYQRLKKG